MGDAQRRLHRFGASNRFSPVGPTTSLNTGLNTRACAEKERANVDKVRYAYSAGSFALWLRRF